MSDVIVGGVSVKGPKHEKNQDSFLCEKVFESYIVAVSDGLGSRKFSEIGSESLVSAAIKILISREGIISDAEDLKNFVAEIHSRWLTSLEVQNFSVEDCNCTCLIMVVSPEKIYAARLGDGFIGFIADEKFFCMFDEKEDRFINETDCLTENFFVNEWQFFELSYKFFGGAVVCTDGVTFGENKAEKFVSDFCRENFNRPLEDILQELKHLLKNWKSSDDKTISFILPEEQR